MLNQRSLQIGQGQLTQFATQDNFNMVMTTAFGRNLNLDRLQQFRHRWLSGDYSVIPDIEVLSQGELGTANGA